MLKLNLQHFGNLMWRANSLEKIPILWKIEGRKTRGQWRMRWLDGITDSGHESEQTPGDSGGQGGLACCSPWGCKEFDLTEQQQREWWKYGSEAGLKRFCLGCGDWQSRCYLSFCRKKRGGEEAQCLSTDFQRPGPGSLIEGSRLFWVLKFQVGEW